MKRLSKMAEECVRCGGECCGKRSPSFFSEKEIRQIIPKDKKGFTGARGYMKTTGICCFYERPYCSIYGRRPIDCRTYPVTIDLRKGKEVFVIDLKCPAVKKGLVGKRFVNHAIKIWKENWPSKKYIEANSKDNNINILLGRYDWMPVDEFLRLL